MCIAILKTANNPMPEEHLREGFKSNPDGCGMGWVENGELHVYKSMDFEDWFSEYNKVIERCGEIQMLIHFRITSRGDTKLDMCHPFWINDDSILIHNGTITEISAAKCIGGRSDTSVFSEEVLRGLPDNWQTNQSVLDLIDAYIGWSKIVILNSDNEVLFFNENQGYWDNNHWYSNRTYKTIVYTPTKYVGKSTSTEEEDWEAYFKERTLTSDKSVYMETCTTCRKDFFYENLTWSGSNCYCNACLVNFTTNKKGEIKNNHSLREEAALVIEESVKERMFDQEYDSEEDFCEICSCISIRKNLLEIWLVSDVAQYSGNKTVCKDCFTDIYASEICELVEILY